MFLKIKKSILELKSVKNLCILSFLIVVKIVISSLKIYITPYIQVSFGFLVYIIVGCLFGPFCSLIFATLSYTIGFFINSLAFFHFGFFISTVSSALIYAVFLYKNNFSYKRVVFATLVNDIFVHFFLNIIWLSNLFYNNDFVKAFIVRFPKGIVMLPIDCLLSFFVVLISKRITKILNFVLN